MNSYKLKDVYWIFGKQKDFKTKKLDIVLMPFVYNKDCTRIKFLNDGNIPLIYFKDKITEDQIIRHCVFSLSFYILNTKILTSQQLYSAYLKITPKILLTAAEKELITKTNPRNVREYVLRDQLEKDLYSVEDILKLDLKFKKAFIKFTKQEAKKEAIEKKQQELKEKELVEDTREF